MDGQGGGPPPRRSSGIGLGLGIGVAAGVGGVLSLGIAALVALAVWRGPSFSRAAAHREGPTGWVPAVPVTPDVVPNQPTTTTARAIDPGKPAAPLATAALYARVSPAVVRIEVRDDKFRGVCTGTGFFVSPTGLVVTNHHVIKGGAFATVETSTGATFFVEGIASDDPKQDLALLKVKAGGLQYLDLGPNDRPPVGTRVFAIGHPLGVRNSVLSEGLVSGVGEALGGTVPSIQTSAPISHGSSGGPLVTQDGAVVGVIVALARDAQNLNFAIPVSLVGELVAKGRAAPLKPLASAGGSALTREQADVLRGAWAAIDRGRLQEAATILTDARAKMQRSNAYWVTAGSLQMELKNYALAAEAFEHAVRLKGDAVESQAMLGGAYYMQQKFKESARAFEAAARLAPRDARYHAAAGRCYMELAQADRAVAFYKKAAALSPGDAAYSARLGDAYFALSQYADAMMAYQASLRFNGGDADTQVSLAQCFMNLRRNDEADGTLKTALGLDPRNARAHLQVGVRHLDRNQPGLALLSFQTAAKLDPTGKVGQAAARAAAVIQAQLEAEQALRERQQRAMQQQQQQQTAPANRVQRSATTR